VLALGVQLQHHLNSAPQVRYDFPSPVVEPDPLVTTVLDYLNRAAAWLEAPPT
jgi:hypothetical protein